MSMLEAVKWVKDALESKDVVAALSHLLVCEGSIRAFDGRITASHPFPYPNRFLVSGEEFVKLLARLGDGATLTADATGATLKSGRCRGTVRTMPDEDVGFPEPDEAWEPVPINLVNTLRLVRPFISDNATRMWSMCAYVFEGHIYASNNVCLVQAKCEGTDDANVLLPRWAIDFLVKRADGLAEWMLSENYVAFRWSNGAWMRTQLVNELFPSQAFDLIATKWEQCHHQLAPDWLEAYERVAALSPDKIVFYKDKMTGDQKALNVEDELTTLLPQGHESIMFDPKFLTPVVSVATHWQPDKYPNPVPFMGRNIRGLIMGKRG